MSSVTSPSLRWSFLIISSSSASSFLGWLRRLFSAPGQGSTFPGFQSLICYEGLHDRFLLEDQLGSIIGELDEQCHRKHEYVYLDYGQPISRPIVYDSAGYTPSVSGPNSFGETTISVSGLPGIDLEGMEVRVSDGTGNYASATIMIRSGSNLVVWDTASPTVASLISSTRSFMIQTCATSWLDGTWEAVDTSTSKLTENDRDLTTIDGSGSIVGYKLIANANNATVFTVTGHDPADPAHKIFVTPSISGIVAAGDHYHLQKWKPISGPPVIATQGGYFTGISGGTNTTFTVFASGAGGAISNFRPWQVGYYLQPNTKKPSYHKILSVTGNTVTVEGNCAALASTGNANHFRVVAPPDVNGFEGGRVYDPVCAESRYLWAGYRYEWPIVGHRIVNTSQPDYNQPGPDGSQTTWDGNSLGQYHCWNRVYDVLMGRWTTTDPAQNPLWNLYEYTLGAPLIASDPRGLFITDAGSGIITAIRDAAVAAEEALYSADETYDMDLTNLGLKPMSTIQLRGCSACLTKPTREKFVRLVGESYRIMVRAWDAARTIKADRDKGGRGWDQFPEGSKERILLKLMNFQTTPDGDDTTEMINEMYDGLDKMATRIFNSELKIQCEDPSEEYVGYVTRGGYRNSKIIHLTTDLLARQGDDTIRSTLIHELSHSVLMTVHTEDKPKYSTRDADKWEDLGNSRIGTSKNPFLDSK